MLRRIFAEPSPDPLRDGETPAWSRREERVYRAVVVTATVWFGLAASWELFGPILAGHYASSASMGIIAENMRRWGIAGPVWSYSAQKPGPDQYYCHHPWGIFWTTRVFMGLFGRHDFVCRLPAVLLSIATPPLLGATSRAIHRPYAGAATALAFVVLPITLSFASFNALEVPVIAHSSLFLWGYVRLTQSSKRRYLVASVVGALLALNADWPAFVLVGSVLGLELVRLVSGTHSASRELDRRRAQWWALCASSAVLTLAMYVVLFREAGKLDDLFGSYQMRSAGNEATLAAVLRSRRYWIELMFTPVAIVIGKVFALVALVRVVATRRIVETVPLAVLAMAAVQYVVFKQGADIHIFWPHYFAQYFALAMGGLVATLAPPVRWLASRRFRRVADDAGLLVLGLAALVLVCILRDGVAALVYAHETGGRFNEKGLRIQSDGDKNAFLRWLAPRSRVIGIHDSAAPTWADVWALGGRPVDVSAEPPNAGSDAVTLLDARFLPDSTRLALFQGWGITAMGPYWALSGKRAAPRVLVATETEPSILERYFVSGTEPHRALEPDPFGEWELSTHYGDPPPLPDREPRTFEEHRIRHNAAVLANDPVRAKTELEALLAGCRTLDARFSDGTSIVCARYVDGAAPTLTLLLAPAGPMSVGTELSVMSRIVARAPWSTTMADPVRREVSFPFTLAPSRWRPGFLYSHRIVVRHRPGTEVFEALLRGRDAPTIARPVEVLRL